MVYQAQKSTLLVQLRGRRMTLEYFRERFQRTVVTKRDRKHWPVAYQSGYRATQPQIQARGGKSGTMPQGNWDKGGHVWNFYLSETIFAYIVQIIYSKILLFNELKIMNILYSILKTTESLFWNSSAHHFCRIFQHLQQTTINHSAVLSLKIKQLKH